MAFVAAPNIVEMQFRTTWDSQRTMNRIFVNVLTAPTQAICQAVANAGLTWWTGNVTALTPANLLLREVYVKDMSDINGFQASASPNPATPGSHAAASLPNNVSICASLRTGLIGRSARGRWFWQGLCEDQVVNNTVDAGLLTSIDSALTNLASALATLGYNWQIVSFNSGGGPRPGGPVYFTVTDIIFVDSTIDSQRRRLPGRGV